MSFGYTVLGFGTITPVAAGASGGFVIANVTDSGEDTAAFTSNPMSSGDVMSITNNASGHSTCTFKFYHDYGGGSQAQLTLGTITDQDFSGRVYTDIMAWESDANLAGSPADIAESSNEVTDLVGTWYFKIINRAAGGYYNTGTTVTIVQLVDGSISTTGTFDVES